MAEYREVVKQFHRMCKSYNACNGCPIEDRRGILYCWRWITEEPVKAEEIIMNWAKEHPVKTNADKFKEVFGDEPFTITLFDDDLIKWFRKEYKESEND